jgi:hypothetical protein
VQLVGCFGWLGRWIILCMNQSACTCSGVQMHKGQQQH